MAQVSLCDGLADGQETEGEHLDLDIESEEQEVHHLDQAGTGEAPLWRAKM